MSYFWWSKTIQQYLRSSLKSCEYFADFLLTNKFIMFKSMSFLNKAHFLQRKQKCFVWKALKAMQIALCKWMCIISNLLKSNEIEIIKQKRVFQNETGF